MDSKKRMIQLPRGHNKGFNKEVKITPPLSSHSWERNNLIVSGQTNGTDTARKSTKRTSKKHPTPETLELFPREKSRTTICSALASLASRLASLERGRDLRTPGVLSFLRSLGLRETKDPDIYCSKMLKVYLVTKREKLSKRYLGFLPIWGIDVNGRYLTARTSAFPKTESGCSLWDILEAEVDSKYFLSERASKRLIQRGISEIYQEQFQRKIRVDKLNGIEVQP